MAFGGCVFCGLNILRKGTDEQKEYWLPRMISGERRMSISISEPDAGSDVGAIRTRAERNGAGLVVNGQKVWNTAAGADDLTLNVYLRTDPAAHYRKGMSLFLIDNDMPGVSLNKLDMLGRHCTGTYEVFFADVKVDDEPHRRRREQGLGLPAVGPAGRTHRLGGGQLRQRAGRGRSRRRYSGERKQFGRPSAPTRRSPICSPTCRLKSRPPGR